MLIRKYSSSYLVLNVLGDDGVPGLFDGISYKVIVIGDCESNPETEFKYIP